jgi:hypothetical protein
MSYLRLSSDLFLELAELQKFKEFLDDDGFRAFLLDNAASFGFIRYPNAPFTNGWIQEDSGLTIKTTNTSYLIDSNGNVITIPVLSQFAIPNDSNWYWVKVAYATSSQEIGTYAVDSQGNLTCTSGNGNFTTLLRGQPNYPSRIQFLNASFNVLQYDVEEVIDNNHATLTGNFTSENNLTLSVVGTFTPGYVASNSEQEPFQYDSYTLTLVQSNTSAPPTSVAGIEFFMARVKNTGTVIYIEDKRDLNIFITSDRYSLSHLDTLNNPLIGVEQITFDDQFTPRYQNILQIAWGLRAVTYTVNLKLNTITISAANGGIFKASNFTSVFTNGDFNGWRVYSIDGKYYKIVTSTLVSGSIVLSFDQLEATSFFSDISSTVPIVQILNVVPDAEEIEIVCTPDQDVSAPSINGIVEEVRVFPINDLFGRIKLTVYDATLAEYTITYRYKHLRSYGALLVIPNDTVGYYNEDQFNVHGELISLPIPTSYSNGLVTLILSPNSYSNFQAEVFLGDLKGVAETSLSNSVPLINLIVLRDRQYQRFTGSLITLTNDLYINLKNIDIDNIVCRNGNQFFLQILQAINLNGHNLYITYGNSSTPSLNTVIKEFTAADAAFTSTSEEGLFFTCTFDGTIWIINNTNEANRNFKISQALATNVLIADNTGGTDYLLATFAALPIASNTLTVFINAQHTPSASQGTTTILKIKQNGSTVFSISYQEPDFSASFFRNLSVMKTLSGFAKGDVITIYAAGTAAGIDVTTINQGEAMLLCNDGDIN